jgi:hypothetical protein
LFTVDLLIDNFSMWPYESIAASSLHPIILTTNPPCSYEPICDQNSTIGWPRSCLRIIIKNMVVPGNSVPMCKRFS